MVVIVIVVVIPSTPLRTRVVRLIDSGCRLLAIVSCEPARTRPYRHARLNDEVGQGRTTDVVQSGGLRTEDCGLWTEDCGLRSEEGSDFATKATKPA
jgi:hypothetical protein